MGMRGLKGGQYKVLSDDQIHQVHLATLEILGEVGVRVEHKPALEMFADNGCKVDFKERIVKIPEHVLKKALSTAPSCFTLHGRSPEFDVEVDTEKVYTIGGSSALYVLDPEGSLLCTCYIEDIARQIVISLTHWDHAVDSMLSELTTKRGT